MRSISCPEPEAAGGTGQPGLGRAGEIGLIVDIGGGTSDFSVFRSMGNAVQILANHGIRLGGTDFDRLVSLAHAMPALGHGGKLQHDGAGPAAGAQCHLCRSGDLGQIPFLTRPRPGAWPPTWRAWPMTGGRWAGW